MTSHNQCQPSIGHTPTPWRFDCEIIQGGNGDILARIPNHPENGKNWDGDAAFICEAVNNYESIRTQLASARKALEEIEQETIDYAAVRIARAALKEIPK